MASEEAWETCETHLQRLVEPADDTKLGELCARGSGDRIEAVREQVHVHVPALLAADGAEGALDGVGSGDEAEDVSRDQHLLGELPLQLVGDVEVHHERSEDIATSGNVARVLHPVGKVRHVGATPHDDLHLLLLHVREPPQRRLRAFVLSLRLVERLLRLVVGGLARELLCARVLHVLQRRFDHLIHGLLELVLHLTLERLLLGLAVRELLLLRVQLARLLGLVLIDAA